MADQGYDSTHNRNSSRSTRSSTVGRARQRQLQRERTQELRQTLGRSALEHVQMPSLKSVQEKLADLNLSTPPASRRSRRPASNGSAGSEYPGRSSTASSRRKPVRLYSRAMFRWKARMGAKGKHPTRGAHAYHGDDRPRSIQQSRDSAAGMSGTCPTRAGENRTLSS